MTMVAWAAVAIGALTAVSSVYSQQQAAKTQAKVQKRASAAERQRLLQEQTAERIQQSFDNEARTVEMQKATKKAREARATARVSAGEAGVSGLSVQALLNDYTRQEGAYRYGLTRQGEQQDIGRELRLKDQGLQSYNNLLSINKPIAQVDYLGSALKGAQAGMSTYSFASDLRSGAAPTTTPTTTPTAK